MIRIGLITHNPELGEALAALGAGGGGDGAELVLNARELDALDGVETLALLFLDAGLADEEKLTALRGKAFRHLAFIGAEPDFEAARLGIRLGIDD